MKIEDVQEMVIIDKSNKWFHTRKFLTSGITFLQVVSMIQVVSSNQMVVPQVILNFK
jgi:hypothetical protein